MLVRRDVFAYKNFALRPERYGNANIFRGSVVELARLLHKPNACLQHQLLRRAWEEARQVIGDYVDFNGGFDTRLPNIQDVVVKLLEFCKREPELGSQLLWRLLTTLGDRLRSMNSRFTTQEISGKTTT